MSALVTADELDNLLEQPRVRVLDASYGQAFFPLGIAGAVDFNIDDIANPHSPFAHTVPSAAIFAEKMGKLGLRNNDLIIVYDRSGIAMAAARAWWMFRLYGHNNVKILDGGLPAWIDAEFPLAEKSAEAEGSSFTATFQAPLLKQLEDIHDNLRSKEFIVLDARDPLRYAGEAADPRPNVQTGHIPASINVPFFNLLNENGTLKSVAELKEIFQTAQVPLNLPLTCSCGSGVTACVIALALFELGIEKTSIYDGSWAEWGADADLPKTKGYKP
jgi:thiosulfate/3-mercaptopyruvate sulfurtransferase